MTALMLAASAGHDDVVFLLTKGLQTDDIHRQTAQGDTALTLAAAAGHADVVDLLIQKGAQQAHKDAALASAAAAGQHNMIGLLVKRGANVNQADAQGMTPFHRAAAHGHLLAVSALVCENADCPEADPGTAIPRSCSQRRKVMKMSSRCWQK